MRLDAAVIACQDDRGPAGELWIGSNGGLSRWTNGRFTAWTERDGLPSNHVRALYEDGDGTLWIGSADGGLGRFKAGQFTRYTTKEGLFDEGRKILDERRERRKMSDASAAATTGQTPPPSEELPPAEVAAHADKAKKELLTSRIDAIHWQNHELEVQHLVRLLETYSRNYHLASEQYAKWGSALVPPIVVHNLAEAENAVAETLKSLETVLSKVYQKDIRTAQSETR